MQEQELSNQLQEIKSLLKKRINKPLTFVEAADYLSISQSHLYKLTSQRKIPFHKPSGKYLYFYENELDEWVKSSETSNVKGEKEEGSSQNEEENEEEKEPP